jgi:alanine-glyoxylate transaminase/serine-glyoxylate transaminase/serine-pyruvate transaminase
VVLETSLKIICKEGITERIKGHQIFAMAFRAAIAALNLKILPKTNKIAANTLTAIYYPKGVDSAALRSKMGNNNIIVAGGLLSKIKASYFRIGHMGSVSSNDLIVVLAALEHVLLELGHEIIVGKSLQTFQRKLLKTDSLTFKC